MTVYPVIDTALILVHPTGTPAGTIKGRDASMNRLCLTIDGVDWPEDGFTCACIAQGIVTDDPSKALQA